MARALTFAARRRSAPSSRPCWTAAAPGRSGGISSGRDRAEGLLVPTIRQGRSRSTSSGEDLYRGQDRVHLTPRPLETLIVLVENRGRTVENQMEAVRGDAVVTEGTLVQAIREIRKAGDDKEDPAFIHTVPREGYRFGELSCEVLPPPRAWRCRPCASSPPA